MKKNKNPVLILTGLAIAAVAVVAGLTRDEWLGKAPMVTAELTTAPETPAPEATAPAEPAGQQAAAEADKTTAEQPPAAVEKPAETAESSPAESEQAAAQPEATLEATPAETEQPKVAETAPEAAPAETEQPKMAEAAPEIAAEAPPVAEAPSQSKVPTFDTVRVEKTGEAVIAGTAEPGAEVVIKLDGAEIGRTEANSGGAFVVVPDQPLPAGVGAITIEAKAEGEAVPTASEQTVAVVVPEHAKQGAVVAVVSPSAPTKVLQEAEAEPAGEQVASVAPEPAAPTVVKPVAPASKQVTLDAVDYDGAGNIVFSGRGQPGHGARIYVDNAHTGDAAIDGGGRWAFAGTADIAIGVHQLRIDGVDAAGKVVNRIEVPFYREQQNKVASIDMPDQTVAKQAETAATAEAGAEVAAAATATPQLRGEGRVVIQPGNNLWRISRVLYGTGTKFTVIYEANKDQIRDPDMIFPGQVFTTPNVVPPAEAVDPKRREPLTPEETAASAQ